VTFIASNSNAGLLVGDEELAVAEGTMVFIPPGTGHAIRNTSSEVLVYVSAAAPPFDAAISGQTWEPRDLTSRR